MDYCTHCKKNVPNPRVEVHSDGEGVYEEYFCPECGNPTANQQATQKLAVPVFVLLVSSVLVSLVANSTSLYVLLGIGWVSIFVYGLIVEDRLKNSAYESGLNSDTIESGWVSLRCACGRSFSAKSSLAGRTYHCPNCGREDYAPPSLWECR